jgi:hypothetical protein
MMNDQDQAAAFIIRKKSRSRRHIAALTPWRAGLVVHAGDFVQSYGMAWEAQGSGTTSGTVAPNNSDGASFIGVDGIQFLHVAVLLTPQPAI